MKKTSGNELRDQLRIRTRELHVKAHSVPYIKALLNNDIKLISYVGHLRALAIIHGTLENQLKQIHNETITEITQGYKSRLNYILSDLEYLNAAEVKDVIPAVNEALNMADKILVYSALNPLRLIGFIYILEKASSLKSTAVLLTRRNVRIL